jgi:uncharacterized protein
MVDPELLKILRCPETRQTLSVADNAELQALNQRVTAGQLKNRAGKPVTEPLQAALVRQDRAVVYPVRNNIPVMLIEEAIPLST